MKWGDFLIIVVTIALSLGLWSKIIIGRNTPATKAEIVSAGIVLLQFDLQTTKLIYQNPDIGSLTDSWSIEAVSDEIVIVEITVKDINLVIEIDKGRVRFSDADCPDRVCVNTGFIYSSGQIAACVPAGVLARVVGDTNSDDPDIILS